MNIMLISFFPQNQLAGTAAILKRQAQASWQGHTPTWGVILKLQLSSLRNNGT